MDDQIGQSTATAPPLASSQAALAGTTCMELALEGERLCKAGDFKNGIMFFEEALKVGTSDDRTLSAIYSQLGNAYFYMEDFEKALENHKKDVTLVNKIGDQAAEAKACGNLGNTFKMLGKFDEAAVYCRRYLEISRKLNDKVGEGRALYNLGNVYHTQGKRMINPSSSRPEQEPCELSNDIKSSLQRAIEYYEMNLAVVTQLNDYSSMGRAYGNLGNTHYLLGNFEEAVESHKKRLELAKKTEDKSAERRAYLNLGNAHVFLGNFKEAIENYTATLNLARELQDKYTEAHSCYSLANTYTFIRDYRSAVTYHLKYLELIKEFDDKLGEGRACWSLVNIFQMVNDHESALTYAKRHHEIAKLLGDKPGLESARLNIEELEEIIAQRQAYSNLTHHSTTMNHDNPTRRALHGTFRLTPDKRQEQEQRRFKKQLNSNLAADIDGLAARRRSKTDKNLIRSSSNERLFDMIAHFQSGRIDEQRCEISHRLNPRTFDDKENYVTEEPSTSKKASESGSTHTNPTPRSSQPSIGNPISAVSAAASAIKATYRKASLVAYPSSAGMPPSIQSQRRPTVSAEHRDQLFDLIATSQRQRMDEQRASLPALALANGNLRNPRSPNLMNRGFSVDQHNARPQQTTSVKKHIDFAKPLPPAPVTREEPSRSKAYKLTRNCQTLDGGNSQGQDEKFLDSLMKYQSTRFDDQRSAFPRGGSVSSEKPSTGQPDNFLNLIVRFQSDRIDDQRSAPPTSSKNL